MNIPYWLLRLLPMWEYICPRCKQEVARNSHECPHCGEKYPLTLKVPPTILKDPKKLEAYVHKHVFPRVSAFERNYLTEFFTVLFSDGQVGSTMETAGDFSAWTGTAAGGGASNTVSTDWAHHGTNSYKDYAMVTWSTAYIYKSFSGVTQENFRAYFKVTDGNFYDGGKSSLFLTESTGNFQIAQVGLADSTRKLYLKYQTSSFVMNTVVSSTTIALNTVYCLELEVKVLDSTHYSIKVYLNGSEVSDLTVTNFNFNYAYVYANRFSVGYREYEYVGDAPPTLTAYFDCVVIADTYIGPESPEPIERSVSEPSISVSDSPAINLRRACAISESSISVSDAVASNLRRDRLVGESLGSPSDSAAYVLRRDRQITEASINVSDAPATMLRRDKQVSEPSISVVDSPSVNLRRDRQVSEPSVSVNDSPATEEISSGSERSVSENLGSVSDSPAINLRRDRQISETPVSVSDTPSPNLRRNRQVNESLGTLSDSPQVNMRVGRQVTEALGPILDAVAAIIPINTVRIIRIVAQKIIAAVTGAKTSSVNIQGEKLDENIKGEMK